MRRSASILAFLSLAPALVLAATARLQDEAAAAPEAVRTIPGILTELYRTVSFDAGGEPDWDGLRSLMLEGAIFIQPPRDQGGPKPISTEGFIELYKGDMERYRMGETGFHERIAAQHGRELGNIAHYLVVFEARLDPESEAPVNRGVDSIQLVRHRDRWWIASITTEFERPGRPIPAELLTSGPR